MSSWFCCEDGHVLPWRNWIYQQNFQGLLIHWALLWKIYEKSTHQQEAAVCAQVPCFCNWTSYIGWNSCTDNCRGVNDEGAFPWVSWAYSGEGIFYHFTRLEHFWNALFSFHIAPLIQALVVELCDWFGEWKHLVIVFLVSYCDPTRCSYWVLATI